MLAHKVTVKGFVFTKKKRKKHLFRMLGNAYKFTYLVSKKGVLLFERIL